MQVTFVKTHSGGPYYLSNVYNLYTPIPLNGRKVNPNWCSFTVEEVIQLLRRTFTHVQVLEFDDFQEGLKVISKHPYLETLETPLKNINL